MRAPVIRIAYLIANQPTDCPACGSPETHTDGIPFDQALFTCQEPTCGHTWTQQVPEPQEDVC